MGASTLRMLATTCPNLVSLSLASCYKLTNEDLKYIGDSFTKLERLDLGNVSVSEGFCFLNCPEVEEVILGFIGGLLRFINHLEKVNQSNCNSLFQSSSSSSRSAVSSSCLSEFITTVGERLTYLNISNNKMAGLPFVFKALSVS